MDRHVCFTPCPHHHPPPTTPHLLPPPSPRFCQALSFSFIPLAELAVSGFRFLECGSFAAASQYSLSVASQRAGATAFVSGFENWNCFSFAGCGHVLGLRVRASAEIFVASCVAGASAVAGEFKLKIAEAVTLVTTAAALSASLGFLTSRLRETRWWFGVAPVGRFLHVRTFVLAHLFHLVFEGRVLDHAEMVIDLGCDRIVPMRGIRLFLESGPVRPGCFFDARASAEQQSSCSGTA